MRELRRCDFCGGDAAGAFEIVPPELEPTEDERRRVVLCPDCKDRLQTLVEPLLARARAGADGESSAAVTEDEGGTDQRSDGETDSRDDDNSDRASESGSGTVVASADESTQKRSRTSSPNASVSDGVAGADDGVDDTETDDSGADAEPASESVLEEGITFERTDPAEAESDAPEAADDATESDDERSSDEETGGSADRDAANRAPAAYGKVLRLLRNREFPMRRSAVEELAGGAYDLESHEVDAIIDHAIERGEFVEKRGELRRPAN